MVMRLSHQFHHFVINHHKPIELPDERGTHVSCESGGLGWIVSLLIGLFIFSGHFVISLIGNEGPAGLELGLI